MTDILKQYCNFLILVVSLVFSNAVIAEDIRIALRAHKGAQKGLGQWQATADYLSEKIPGYRFIMVPFENNSALNQAVSRGGFHFSLTNPAAAIEHKIRYGAQPIATLVNKRQGKGYSKFGSVIFTRADRKDINELKDLKGKTFIGVDELGFGGWRIAWGELLSNGINPYTDFKEVHFAGGVQQKVVYDVRDGSADAGSVRTDMLERLAASGKIKLDNFKVLGKKQTEDFPFLHSTELYPEWLFSAVRQMDDSFKTQVISALFSIPGDGPAAKQGKYVGWISPLDYAPVDELLKELNVGPYNIAILSPFERLVNQYGHIVITVIIVIFLLMLTIIYMLRLNRRIALARNSLRNEVSRRKTLEQSLLDAKQAAEYANKSKSEFLANVSHEIRTPMNGVLGMIQVLRGTALNKEQQLYIKTLDSSSKSLLLLIDELLDLSKIESGKLVLDIKPFETFGWITDIQNLTEPLFENKKTVFITKVSNDLPVYLEGDATRLLQITVNLLSNAAKYTHDGEVKLTIGGQLITENQFNLHISVKDTGTGIADDKLSIIFEAFHQLKSDRSIKNGVGLGLAICKRLTDIMDGSLKVTSRSGKGSCFTFAVTIPVPEENFRSEDTGGKLNINRRLSILLVDDDSINRFSARTLLEQAGHRVIEAENGQVAIEKEKSQFFDVILMDVHMPVMNGVLATRTIREGSTKGKQVPIIGLTASVMNDEKDLYLKAGMNAVVEKPILIEKLMKTIQQLL